LFTFDDQDRTDLAGAIRLAAFLTVVAGGAVTSFLRSMMERTV
jgi:hypothetical protein